MLASSLADAHHHTAISAEMLARYKPQPGCQMSTIFEVAAVTDCGDHCRSSLWPNTADFGDPLTGFTRPEDRVDLLVECANALINLKHEGIQATQDLARQLS
jgi:hypothetical protein